MKRHGIKKKKKKEITFNYSDKNEYLCLFSITLQLLKKYCTSKKYCYFIYFSKINQELTNFTDIGLPTVQPYVPFKINKVKYL